MAWLTALLWLLVLTIAILVRWREGTWYSPAAFFTGSWSVLTGLALVAGPISVAPAGILFVIGAGLAVFIGAEAARRLFSRVDSPSPISQPFPLLEWLMLVCTLLGLATVELVLASRGRGPEVFLSIRALADTARDFSVARYGNIWQEPIAARLLVSFTYLGALLAGVFLATRKSGWTRWLALVVLLPAAMMAAVLTTKLSLLLPLTLGVSAFLAVRLSAQTEPPRIDLTRAAWLAGAAIVVGSGLVLVQMGRYAYTTPSQAGTIVTLFTADLFAYLGVFSSWLEHGGWANVHPAWGFYTFAGAFDLLHLGQRVPGLYTDQVTIDGAPYNIYTAFRGLIQDFTLPGALVALAIFGFGAQGAYRKVRLGDIRYSAALAAFYLFTLWSFAVGIFIYNTVLVAFLLLAVYLASIRTPLLRRIAAPLDVPWRGVHAVRRGRREVRL
jgi:oligosaccharide repeat unit polymerase